MEYWRPRTGVVEWLKQNAAQMAKAYESILEQSEGLGFQQ